MANFLVVENDKVVNVIVADSQEIAEEITQKIIYPLEDYPEVWLNWTFVNDEWIAPAKPEIDEAETL